MDDAIRAAGLGDAPRLHVSTDRYAGFIEAHIEQGPTLEDTGNRIGVVTDIVGLRGIRFVFRGQQNHAGTTMMARRRDAASALYELAYRVNSEFPKVAAERTVWTMGRLKVEPNATSIVPGYADLDLQFRDASEAPLDAFEQIVARIVDEMNARGGVTVEASSTRPSGTRRGNGCGCRAERFMMRGSFPRGCRRRCCSFRRLGASATILRRTAATEISCWGVRC
jgi:N-carbamoyl-L-amino-acid hydrolase